MKFIESSLMGNVLGIISLAVGFIGLVVTIITMKSAKRIEENVNKAKVEALNKSKFNAYRPYAIKKLEQKRRAALKTNVLTYIMCNDALSIINDLDGFSTVLLEEDAEKVQLKIKELRNIAGMLSGSKKQDFFNIQYNSILSEIINILKKGDYDL